MNTICFFWSYTSPAWNKGDWTWSDCELASEVCAIWGTKNVWWKNANFQWGVCTGSVIPPVPPPTGSIVISASLQPLGVDATTLVQPWLIEPWNPYTAADEHDKKRKRLIKLICKVKGQTYEEEKRVGDMKISVDDIRMVVKAVSNIDLDVKLEE